jgi:hypothetical protein
MKVLFDAVVDVSANKLCSFNLLYGIVGGDANVSTVDGGNDGVI